MELWVGFAVERKGTHSGKGGQTLSTQDFRATART